MFALKKTSLLRAGIFGKNAGVSGLRLVLAALLPVGGAGILRANPLGLTVSGGSASSVAHGNTTTITASQNAMLNWQSFNIGAGETTTFVQPSPVSIVWNRITDPNPSQIFGHLNANGIVVLMNQSGFYFGPNSVILAGGFVATTVASPPEFSPGGQWQFGGTPPSASIINYGEVKVSSGGSLFLIADAIENHGTLSAPDGTLGLYAGKQVLVSDRPDGRGISAAVTLPGGAVNNVGKLIADGGSILVHAQTVNQDGLIQADSVRNQNGVIELVASDSLNLGANSQILARGDSTTPGSAGGSVTLKSDNNFSDSIGSQIVTAGGALGGNGGNVEVSAANILSLNTSMDATAQAGGLGGQFLLDPATITLGNSGTGSSGNGTVAYNSGTGTLALNVATAFANKNFSAIKLQATGNISLLANTVWNLSTSTGNNSGLLTLQAGGNIIFNGNSQIFDANNWSVNLQAGVAFPGHLVPPGTGSIWLSGGANSSLNGAIQTAQGSITLSAAQDILVGSGYVRTTGGGMITATAQAGNINTGGKKNGFLFHSAGAPYTVDPNLGGISTAAGGNVSLTAGNDIVSYLPTAGTDGDAGSGAFGPQAGNVTLRAGHDVVGHYVVANGVGTINAGDDAGNPGKSLALSLVSGSWNVNAGQDINLQEVRNPNGVFNALGFSTSTTKHFFDYSPGASVDLTAAHSVNLLGASLPRNTGSFEQNIPEIFPGTLDITAGAGGVNVANNIILAPSPSGQLTITTTGGGALNGTKSGDLTQIIMSDSGASQYSSAATFGADDHAATPLHLNDPVPVSLNIAGDLNNVLLVTPKATDITVGGNLVNSRFQIQNLHATDVSSLNVVGDIINRNEFTTVPLATAPDFSVFNNVYPPLEGALASLSGLFNYDKVSQTLTFQGRMSNDQLQALLNLQVQVFDALGNPVLDANGNPVTKPATFASAATLQALFTSSQDVPQNPDTGYFIAGPGVLNVNARNMDLGATRGIQSIGPEANAALAPLGKSGASINVNLTGNLDMFSTTISTIFGGNVSITAGGSVNVGSTTFSGNDQNARGIFTVAKGDVSVIAGGDINVNGSRIGAYDGGNVTVKSLHGNVDAGTGGQGFGEVQEVTVDPVTGLVGITALSMPGSGIFALSFPLLPGIPNAHNSVGSIDVETPQGNITARGAGILQLPLNGVDSPNTTITLIAGSKDANGKVLFKGNIDLSGSGLISLTKGNKVLDATGQIIGNIVSPFSSINLAAASLQNIFALGQSISVNSPSADSSVTLVGQSVNTGPTVSGNGPDIISTSANGGGSTVAHNDVAGATSQAAQNNNDTPKTVAANDAGTDAPGEKTKKKPGLTKASRVTVILPKT